MNTRKYFRSKLVVRRTRQNLFPVDMLRYDHCCPATETDAYMMERALVVREDVEDVTLLMYHADPKARPNTVRWAAYGWLVVSCERDDP